MMEGISDLDPSRRFVLKHSNVQVRVEVDDGDEGQAFNVPAWLDDIPAEDLIAHIVDPQGQGRAVQSLVNAAGDVVNSIHPFLETFLEPDFRINLIANWGEPRSKMLQYIKRHIEKMEAL